MKTNLQIFECSSIKKEIDNRVTIGINSNPKSKTIGSYMNDGKSSLPLVYMLIRHNKSGITLVCEALDKRVPFEHTCTLVTKYKTDVLPEINEGDLFASAGFIVPCDVYMPKTFNSISFEG